MYIVLNVAEKSEFWRENEVLGKFRIGFGVKDCETRLGLWFKLNVRYFLR